MAIENIKNKFPEMPEEIRIVVAHTVAKQLQLAPERPPRRKGRGVRRGLFIALAAALALGGTAVAADFLHRFRSEPVGLYGANIVAVTPSPAAETAVSGEDSASAEASAEAEAEPVVIARKMNVIAGWLPDGVTLGEKDHYYDAAGELILYAYGEHTNADGSYQADEIGVTYREDIMVGSHEAVYMEVQRDAGSDPMKWLYISFPEDYYVVQVNTVGEGANLDKDIFLKFAENLTLEPVHGSEFYLSGANSVFSPVEEYTAVSREAMANTHSIGDTFTARFGSGMGVEDALGVRVSQVQLGDDLSLLDPQFVGSKLQSALDGSGHLKPATLQYIHWGDGINSLDETVYTEDVARKLLLVTMEITNTTDRTLEDISFFPGIVYLEETEGGYAILDKVPSVEKTAPNGQKYNYIGMDDSGSLNYCEMAYYDTTGWEGRNGGNYIYELAPGETATLHIGYLVTEYVLPYLYFGAEGYSDTAHLTSDNLEAGYVDIRR